MQNTVPEADAFTLRNVRRDFVEWHLGRPHYALWALEFDTAPLQDCVAAAQAHLAPWLLDGYRRQPHITLCLCGFPTAQPNHADDFSPAQWQAQVAALQRAKPVPFALSVSALATFTSVPYLAVQGGSAALQALRNALGADPASYVPHITLGLYAQAWPMAEVRRALDAFVCPPGVQLQVSGVSLVSYASADIGGPLQTLARYDFASATLHCTAAGAWLRQAPWHGDCVYAACPECADGAHGPAGYGYSP